jgi:hypothetical protein
VVFHPFWHAAGTPSELLVWLISAFKDTRSHQRQQRVVEAVA